MLTWREVVVLEDAYISSQRNHLENVANALDKHLQYNVDKLIFLRNGMREALVAPLDFTSLRDAVTEFEQHRDEHAWQIELNRRRTLSVNGVSDALVSEGNLLSRENESLDNEITAALEVGYLLRLAHNTSSMVEQAMYVSRAGFYVSTQPTLFTRNVPTRYYGYVTQPWFIGHSQRENRHRAVRWFTSQPEHASNTEPQVTVSVPVDSNNYWYGVLGMSIPVRTMQQFLRNAIDKNLDGEYQLYDSKLRFLTSSNPDHPTGNIFDPRELALLAQAMEHDTRGGIRMDSRYVRLGTSEPFRRCAGARPYVKRRRARRFRQYQHCINPAVGALYHHVTHLLVCDSPDGQQHVCSAKLVAVAGVARHLNPFI